MPPRDELFGDGIYPAALTLMNARVGELLCGKWTKEARRRARLASLQQRYDRFLAGVREPIGAPPHDRIPVEVLGPCLGPAYRCCRTGFASDDGCSRFNGCACKVRTHAVHGRELLGPATELAGFAQAAAVLTAS